MRWLLAVAVAVAGCAFALLGVAVLAAGSPGCGQDGVSAPVSGVAVADIPADYLASYVAAGERFGVGWSLLAGVGSIETDHGRLDAPGIRSGTNSAGAAGPMQFLLSTWRSYGVDGDRDGDRDVYDPRDAIPGAASYLRASGAPQDVRRALFAYNHASWYVDDVLARAARYRAAGEGDPLALAPPLDATDAATGASDAAACAAGDGSVGVAQGPRAVLGADGLALAPAGAPASVVQVIAAGNELQRYRYNFGGGHASFPDPSRADAADPDVGYDCSSSTSFVLWRAGLWPRRAGVSGEFGALGPAGAGRWITVHYHGGHVFLVVAGLRLDTSSGWDSGPNAGREGPKWRLGARSTAGFAVAHPEGL